MKLLAINGSPRGKEGNTERILEPFLAGVQAAGVQTETIYLKDHHVNHCIGCFSCWAKNPGVCIFQDDMAQMQQKVLDAEIIVYASPLYVYTVSGLMKDFLDRLFMPLNTPNIAFENGRYFHPRRNPEKWPKKNVLISNCGFPGRYNFDGLCETFKIMLGNDLQATIVCSQGELLQSEKLIPVLTPYFKALETAGRELIESGSITPKTQTLLDREFIDPMIYLEKATRHWEKKQE
jgi:multimeric flavodoxin WrbA